MARTVVGRTVRIVVLAVAAAIIGVVVWGALAFRATPEAVAAMRSDARVTVLTDSTNVVRFTPSAGPKTVPMGLVFFPGAFADPVSYAPLARALAAAGYPVILVPLPKRGAQIGRDVADVIHTAMGAVHEDDRAEQWLVAGHSVGASVAMRMAVELAQLGGRALAGLVLIGTAQPTTNDLSKIAMPVTKIVGTKDGVASFSAVQANKSRLPASTRWVIIEGGNHSQFAWYGLQPGDRPASISAAVQHQQLIDAMLETLRLATDRAEQMKRQVQAPAVVPRI